MSSSRLKLLRSLFAIALAAASVPAQAQMSGESTPPETNPPQENNKDNKANNKESAKETPKETPKTPQQAARESKKEEHEPADPDTGKSTLSDETLGLLPNPLRDKGVKFSLSYVGEALGNVSGGLRRGAIYEGRWNAAVDIDFQTLANWRGLSFHANVFQIHGDGLSRRYVGNLITVSSIEALPSSRLYEVWLEQKLGRLSIRAGQLAADTEFLTSKYTDVFINASYGWPTILGVNLPSGGPSPPLAAVGMRAKIDFTPQITGLAAVFNGDAAGPGPGDPQERNRTGTNFRTRDPAFVIGEIQYAYNQGPRAKGLPGTIKFGAWRHFGAFDDQRFAANGVSLASPAASAEPAQHRGNHGVYAVAEQMVAAFGGNDGTRGVGVFARGSTSPSDRNLIDWYVDAGVNVTGAADARPHDKLGIGVAYARISPQARRLDDDYAAIDQRPARSFEAVVLVSYLMEMKQGWNIYPTLQYIVHPGGGYVMQDGRAVPLRDAAVVGVRSVAKF